ncbi:MAG TPA: adenylate/guanylate cyclase domain-containing protein, partial [Candidatus Binataceae bacterium]|nr:adenylate/guanylate cyclase domain-containing protein [Candidatus Binataceae bacterium]
DRRRDPHARGDGSRRPASTRACVLKIGIHEGSCLAVTLNDQQDYFGQTVNIASRVQGLAASHSIVVTEQVVENALASALSMPI